MDESWLISRQGEKKYLQSVQTGYRAQSASYSMDTESVLPEGKREGVWIWSLIV
jgi:hypothetical protein